jgi:hypothetical protein
MAIAELRDDNDHDRSFSAAAAHPFIIAAHAFTAHSHRHL